MNSTYECIEYLKSANANIEGLIELSRRGKHKDIKMFEILFNGHTIAECSRILETTSSEISQVVRRYYYLEKKIKELGGSPIWYKTTTRIINVCSRIGIKSIEELCNMPYEKLASQRSLGNDGVYRLVRILNKNGLHPLFEYEAIAGKQNKKKGIKEWIPCNVKLPDTSKWDKSTVGMAYLVTVCEYPGDEPKVRIKNFWRSRQSFMDHEDVVAWMELPEPYEDGDPVG